METPLIGSTTLWPTVSEAHEVGYEQENGEESGEWELLSVEEPRIETPASPHQILKHSESSPNFGSIYCEDDDDNEGEGAEASFLEICPEGEEKSISTSVTDASHVLVEAPSSVGGKLVKVHRVPSFKDAILLNAQEIQREEKRKEEASLNSLTPKRKTVKPRFVVKSFSRCSKSTPNLANLSKVIEDESCDEGDEDLVLGETDASDFYARKSLGYKSRQKAMTLRPDEAKRKEFILHKKNAQRTQNQKRI